MTAPNGAGGGMGAQLKEYLSFGGGVNSVALLLFMADSGHNFEPVFVNHGGDWPETYHYVAMFQWWLKKNGYQTITILQPSVRTIEGKIFHNIYDYYNFRKFFPSRQSRACTDRWKIKTLEAYQASPSWVYIGYAADESHRARVTSKNGYEYRWPLIENGIDRDGCIKIIREHDLPVPQKSGCYFCPFQSKSQWIQLREQHPELFCKATTLEDQYIERRADEGKKPIYIGNKKLSVLIDEVQIKLWEEDEYPPCQCAL